MPRRKSSSSIQSDQTGQSTEQSNPGLLDAILASATDYALITTDQNGVIATWNKGAEQIFGYKRKDIIGKLIGIIFTEKDRIAEEPTREILVARDTGRSSDIRWHQRQDGTCFWADGVMTPIKNTEGDITGYMKILRDDTQRKIAEDKLLELARIDMLTNVANRAAFQERLIEMSHAALRNKELLILHLLDLDNFKQVNDRWGHPTGDKLLQHVAQRIRDVTRDTDFTARLGGDEFVVLQSNVHNPEAGGALAEKLVETLSKPFQIGDKEIIIGVSIGIVLFPQDEDEPEQLLRKADLALYKVKNDSRNGYHYFSEQLDSEAHKKGRLLAALRRATKSRSFWLEYQPEIDTVSGKTVAVEALLRCRDPLLANYGIEKIISLATESGLMLEIGAWVMTEACSQVRKWQDAGFSDIKMCVNLCPRELTDPNFEKNLNEILARYDLRAQDLELEITERDAINNHGQNMDTVASLRNLGISIAIDDFGTGYSALSQLRNLPIDKLKLDQSFLQRIPADPESCAIASAVISLAHTLKLKVVVEGVESAEQVAFFEREHCETLQGYFFTRPLKVQEMTNWLENQAKGGASTMQ